MTLSSPSGWSDFLVVDASKLYLQYSLLQIPPDSHSKRCLLEIFAEYVHGCEAGDLKGATSHYQLRHSLALMSVGVLEPSLLGLQHPLASSSSTHQPAINVVSCFQRLRTRGWAVFGAQHLTLGRGRRRGGPTVDSSPPVLKPR
eukprot:1405298-Rhodomonas_salina.2